MTDLTAYIEEFYKKPVNDIMYTHDWDLPIVPEDADLFTVLGVVTAKGRAWVVETMEHQRVVGVITEKTLLDAVIPTRVERYSLLSTSFKYFSHAHVTTAGVLMSKNPVSCTVDAKVEDAIMLMKKYRIRHLPILDNEGILWGEVVLRHIILGLSHCFQKKEC